MLDNLVLLAIIGFITELLLYSYVGYWALAIRRALAVRLYRNQALGTFLITLVAGFSSLYIFLSILVPNFGNGIEGVISVTFISLGLFYWVDASMLAARRSDPASRNILHWQQVRMVLWVLNIADSSYLIVLDIIAPFYTYGGPLVIVPFLIAVFSGAIFLPIAARRTKDIAFRRHLKWFGIFFLTLLLSYPFSALGGLLSLLVLTVIVLIGGYCLYRSVRSLVEVHEHERFRIVHAK